MNEFTAEVIKDFCYNDVEYVVGDTFTARRYTIELFEAACMVENSNIPSDVQQTIDNPTLV